MKYYDMIRYMRRGGRQKLFREQEMKEGNMRKNTVWRGMRKRALAMALAALMVMGGGYKR